MISYLKSWLTLASFRCVTPDSIGDQIPGTASTIFKVRAKNSDIPAGKSGGYRLIYQVVSPYLVLLLLIYAKSDQSDISLDEIKDAIRKSQTSR